MTGAVLCAIDVSNGARDAHVLKEARRQALTRDAQLDVITIIPDFGTSLVASFFDKDHHAKIFDQTKEELNSLCSEVLGADVNSGIRHIIGSGSAYEEILAVAEKDGAELIVVGAHKPDLKDFLLGPNAARVVRHARISVLVVR